MKWKLMMKYPIKIHQSINHFVAMILYVKTKKNIFPFFSINYNFFLSTK